MMRSRGTVVGIGEMKPKQGSAVRAIEPPPSSPLRDEVVAWQDAAIAFRSSNANGHMDSRTRSWNVRGSTTTTERSCHSSRNTTTGGFTLLEKFGNGFINQPSISWAIARISYSSFLPLRSSNEISLFLKSEIGHFSERTA